MFTPMYTRYVRIPLLCLALLMAIPAGALPLDKYSQELATIPFGKGTDEVLKYIQTVLEKRDLQGTNKPITALKQDEIRTRHREILKNIKGKMLVFNGKKSGYEVSIIGPEFAHKTNEVALRFDDGAIIKYYFFINNKLWKTVWTYPQRTTFKQLSADLIKALGPPHTKADKTESPTMVHWEDTKHVLTARDTTKRYSMLYFMVADTPIFKNIKTMRGGKEPSANANNTKEFDSEVDDISGKSGTGSAESVIDDITGSDSTVDMNLGKKRVYEPKEEEPEKKKSKKSKRRSKRRE